MRLPAIDRRRLRANALTAHVLHIVSKYLCEHGEEDAHREVSRELMTLFYDSGAEIITDEMRAEAGLPPRGPDGWTDEELQALELKRLEALMQPVTMPLDPANWIHELTQKASKP